MLLIQGEDPSVLLNGICTLLVTHCFLLSEPGRELRAILSGVAFLLAEETLHIRRGCCSFFVACLCSFLCFFFALVFALLFTLAFAFVLTFAFHERVDFHWRGVVPVRYAPLSVRLMRRFPTHFCELHILAASSRSDQHASAILDLVGCVPVLLF